MKIPNMAFHSNLPRRSLLSGALGSLAAAAGFPRTTVGQDVVAASPAPFQPLAQDYTVVLAQAADKIRKLDSVGLAKLRDGQLIAVVTVEPKGPNYVQVVESEDGGATWCPTAQLPYNAATPFVHNGALHLFAHPKGTKPYREDELMLVRSADGGRTWSDPVKLFEGHFWNVQTGMAIRDGHLYWSADDFVATAKRGPRVFAGDLSADLMNPKAWRMSNHVEFPGLPDSLLNPALKGNYPSQRMLEPNVILVNGRIRVLACVNLRDWQRFGEREAFIPLADPDGTRMDRAMIQATAPIKKNGRLWFYYRGDRLGHDSFWFAATS
jgi:hypothetical protein